MIYNILLENNKIGTTLLEFADPPMGVVYGKIEFIDNSFTYNFFGKYCYDNNIDTEEYPQEKLINTNSIPTLKVVNENGLEIEGLGCSIAGQDSEGFEIVIIGIPYPFYAQEFPNHVKNYEERFN